MMKTFSLSFSVVVLYILSTNISGDRIHLRDGKVVEGTVVKTEEEFIFIDDFEKIQKISTRTIESIEMGYTGIPVCTQTDGLENCQKILHSLDRRKAIFLVGKGQIETETVKTKSLEKISWKRRSPKERFASYIRSNVRLLISTKHETYETIFVGKKNSDTLEFQSPKNQVIVLKESEILKWEWNRDKEEWDFTFQNFLPPLVPGLVQFQNGELIKGGVLLTGASATLLGSFVEFQNARNNSKSIQYLIPASDRILLIQQARNRNAVRSQLRNRNLFLGLALLFYIYHIWDLQQTGELLSSDLHRFQHHSAPITLTFPARWEGEREGFSAGLEFSWIFLKF